MLLAIDEWEIPPMTGNKEEKLLHLAQKVVGPPGTEVRLRIERAPEGEASGEEEGPAGAGLVRTVVLTRHARAPRLSSPAHDRLPTPGPEPPSPAAAPPSPGGEGAWSRQRQQRGAARSVSPPESSSSSPERPHQFPLLGIRGLSQTSASLPRSPPRSPHPAMRTPPPSRPAPPRALTPGQRERRARSATPGEEGEGAGEERTCPPAVISLLAAAAEGNCGRVESVVKEGLVPVDATDEGWFRDTALHYAALEGQDLALDALLRLGASVNAANSEGRTALHYAAVEGRIAACRRLLAEGGEVSARNREGATPEDEARAHHNWEVAELLRKYREALPPPPSLPPPAPPAQVELSAAAAPAHAATA